TTLFRSGLDRLHHGAGIAGIDAVAHRRQFDVDQVAKQALGVVGNADGDLAVAFDAGPLVGLHEPQVARDLAHAGLRISRVGGRVALVYPKPGGATAGGRPPVLVQAGLPSRTKGNFTTRTGTSRPRMSTLTPADSSPAGTRANAIALPSVGEKVPERISPAPCAVRTAWPWRSTPFSSITSPMSWRGAPSRRCASSTSRPTKSRSGSSETVQPSAAS